MRRGRGENEEELCILHAKDNGNIRGNEVIESRVKLGN